jgi:hypothetical protein
MTPITVDKKPPTGHRSAQISGNSGFQTLDGTIAKAYTISVKIPDWGGYAGRVIGG